MGLQKCGETCRIACSSSPQREKKMEFGRLKYRRRRATEIGMRVKKGGRELKRGEEVASS